MTRLIRLKDGTPGLLFVVPFPRVIRLVGATYDEARRLLAHQITEDNDRDSDRWARIVAKTDGTIDAAGLFEVRR